LSRAGSKAGAVVLESSTAAGSGEALHRPAFDALLYFGRHDLEKGPRAPWRPLFATGVDPRFDHFPGVRCFNDLTLSRLVTSQFRKAKP
jgi:hypothetical protein